MEDSKRPVAFVHTKPENLAEDVRRVMELTDWRQYITPGTDIALKPNLGWDKLIPGSISAPWVVEAVIETIKDYVGKIFMVESDQVVVKADQALALSRLDKVCQRHQITWVNMSRGKFIDVDNPERLVLKHVRIPEILTKTELITLPLLKTHNKTTITGALKNQWGCLDTIRHNYHLVIPQALVDINSIVRPKFAVMDGTVALEGNGPKSGIPREMNVLLASANLAGMDGVAAQLMGFNPQSIEHIVLCAQHGLGSLCSPDQIIGDEITSITTHFVHARHNAISWLELFLRRSRLEYLVFQTPLLKLFCWGTRRYYDAWDLTVGNRLRNDFLRKSAYAKQWQ